MGELMCRGGLVLGVGRGPGERLGALDCGPPAPGALDIQRQGRACWVVGTRPVEMLPPLCPSWALLNCGWG